MGRAFESLDILLTYNKNRAIMEENKICWDTVTEEGDFYMSIYIKLKAKLIMQMEEAEFRSTGKTNKTTTNSRNVFHNSNLNNNVITNPKANHNSSNDIT